MIDPSSQHFERWFPMAIGVLALLVFLPTLRFGFVSYDDPGYVYENPQVMAGLTWRSIAWAWTTDAEANWHPLTWMSHMLDATLFGDWAGGHHLTAALIHAANAALVCLVLTRLTGRALRSAAVALLFAVHPLRAESVAWVAERKDVLSTLLALLAMLAYVRHARQGGRRWLAVTCGFHALSLLAKPMYVTLPALLLVLDFWPLCRMHRERNDRGGIARSMQSLVIEKLPLLALSIASSVVTMQVQSRNMPGAALVEPTGRVINAAVAYAMYLGKLVRPMNLACFYPHPGRWPAATVAVALFVLAAITVAMMALVRRWPAGIVGWLWFLGMSVPTIGLVQVGFQAMADRYSYFPSIGVTFLVVWAVADLLARLPNGVVIGFAITSVAAALLIGVTSFVQLPTWRNSQTLFEHAVFVTGPNAVTSYNLGNEYSQQGKAAQAIDAYETALRAGAVNPKLHNNLGVQFLITGQTDEAIRHFRRAVEQTPRSVSATSNLASALSLRPETMPEALRWFARAAELAPNRAEWTLAWARALAGAGDLPGAAAKFELAARQRPGWAEPFNALGVIYARRGMTEQAIACFRRAVEAEPTNADARANLQHAQSMPPTATAPAPP